MNAQRTKAFRKVFKDRRQYRAYKKAYTQASLPKQLQTIKVINQIIASGKQVKILNLERDI